MPVRLSIAISTAILCAAQSALGAGSLNPPGSPAPTPALEPRIAINEQNTPGDAEAFYVIGQPGSYYLTRNVFNRLVSSTRNGIVIEASDVTIDLNGFLLDGYEPFTLPLAVSAEQRGLTSPTVGILASGTLTNITIRNGSVRDWNNDGINLNQAELTRIEGVSAVSNGNYGIWGSTGTLIVRCSATENGDGGILGQIGSTISECVALGNGGHGIHAGGQGSTVIACTSSENGQSGIRVNTGTLVTQCTVARNTGHGIEIVNGGSHVRDNSCFFNGFSGGVGAGIMAGSGTRVDGNNLESNDIGVEVSGSNAFVLRNTAEGNGMNYSITGTHIVGPMVTSQGDSDFAHPWANFSL